MWVIDRSVFRGGLLAVSIVGLLQLGCSDKHRSRIVAPNRAPTWHYAGDWAYDMTATATRLLYRHLPSVDGLGGVYMMDLESPDLARTFLFPDSLPYFTNDCRFSPDGKKVSYTRDALFDIYVRNLEDGTDQRITFTFGNAKSADWDPSGRFIVYEQVSRPYGAPDSIGSIHIVDTQTLADWTFRVGGQPVYGENPRWSPDSTYIAYSRIAPTAPGSTTSYWHIWVARVDGSSKRDITANSRWENELPEWLGNGEEVMFESRSTSSQWVHVTQAVRPDGSGLRTLPVDVQPGIAYDAVARTAGKYAYTDGDSASNFGVLFLRRLDDGSGTSIRQLTTFKPLPEWIDLSGSPAARY